MPYTLAPCLSVCSNPAFLYSCSITPPLCSTLCSTYSELQGCQGFSIRDCSAPAHSSFLCCLCCLFFISSPPESGLSPWSHAEHSRKLWFLKAWMKTPGLNSRESSHGHSWEGVRGCGQALLVGHQQPGIVPTGSLSSPVTRVGLLCTDSVSSLSSSRRLPPLSRGSLESVPTWHRKWVHH